MKLKNEEIKRIHISFSAGETSAWMTYYLLRVKYKCQYNEELNLHVGFDEDTQEQVHVIVTFANTSQENEETLVFAKKCDDYFEFHTVWLECVARFKIGGVIMNVIDRIEEALNTNWIGARLGTRHRVVDFQTANRDGLVYESVIARYGIPNNANAICTRELKLRPMTSYLRSVKWKANSYYSAIGLRIDEFDRVNDDHKKLKLFYPAISMRPMTKPQINSFWALQPFRLMLKGYQGNCKWCFKKHDPKLWQLAKESPEIFDFPMAMEHKYGNYITPDRQREMIKKGNIVPDETERNYTFFRKNRSVKDILEESKDSTKQIIDDSEIYETESCEIYSNCGDR
jgi:3'-phosphoadenosine 5'-phosphosulfate sulfotransferase (PAPS reductase)/FAD synthetase